MTSTEPRPDVFDPHTDEPIAEQLLLAAARDGSTGAFGILYARHREYAVATARRALPAAESSHAEDVAEMAFIRVFTALRNGSGPTDTLRYYLATSVRREAWRTQRRRRRQAQVVDRWAVDDAAARREAEVIELPSVASDLDAHVLLGAAFRALSDRWRHVLWLTEVEGRKPAEIAPMLGVTAGSASALAYRARQGLLTAYLNAYRDNGADEACRELTERLGLYVAAGRITEGFDDVIAHLDHCRPCRDVSRGVDVMGGVLSGLAPFGLLTAGLWAKGVAASVGAGAVAGSAAAGVAGAGALHAAGSAGSGAAGAAGPGGPGAASVAGIAAGAVAVAIAVAAVAFGAFGGSGHDDSAASVHAATSAPPATVQTSVRAEVTTVSSPGATPSTAPAATTTVAVAAVPVSRTTTTAPGALGPRTTVPATVSTTTAVSPSTIPRASTTTSSTTTTAVVTTASITTTTTPGGGPHNGQLSGGAFVRNPLVGGPDLPAVGLRVTVSTTGGSVVGEDFSATSGRWLVPGLADGHYVVVATVPMIYAPESGPDPWTGGLTWQQTLGEIDLAGGRIDLVDLRLVLR